MLMAFVVAVGFFGWLIDLAFGIFIM